ncbi:vWA domain-containing protein [Sulfurimonas sp. NWX367]|uniref:vWA domain-containing protein n=1 Tax=Sulfurimonas sp. NWX367 TaxID=2925413 RepID=UPI0032048A02
MYKILFLLFLTTSIVWGDTFVFVDLSAGMNRSQYNELGRLTYFNKSQKKTIYKNREKVYFYAFKGNIKLKTRARYSEQKIGEQKYKENNKKFMRFFIKIKKGVKPPKKGKLYGDVIFLVDISGSMVNKKHNYLREVKTAMEHLIKNKAKNTKVSIITFDGKKNMPAQKRSKILADNLKNKERLLSITENIKVSRNDTFLGSGLKKAMEVLPLQNRGKRTIMIFTDGAKINDEKVAKAEIKNLEKDKVDVKVVAVGGADVAMLKKFSTSGYVYNATSTDLTSIIKDMSTSSDEIVLNLDNFFDGLDIKKNDKIIIYSTMKNIDNISDFDLVPNLASKDFYQEFKRQNKERGINLHLNGAKVYVRVLGDEDLSKIKKLKTFWNYFFRDSGAQLIYFKNEALTKDEF